MSHIEHLRYAQFLLPLHQLHCIRSHCMCDFINVLFLLQNVTLYRVYRTCILLFFSCFCCDAIIKNERTNVCQCISSLIVVILVHSFFLFLYHTIGLIPSQRTSQSISNTVLFFEYFFLLRLLYYCRCRSNSCRCYRHHHCCRYSCRFCNHLVLVCIARATVQLVWKITCSVRKLKTRKICKLKVSWDTNTKCMQTVQTIIVFPSWRNHRYYLCALAI